MFLIIIIIIFQKLLLLLYTFYDFNQKNLNLNLCFTKLNSNYYNKIL